MTTTKEHIQSFLAWAFFEKTLELTYYGEGLSSIEEKKLVEQYIKESKKND